MIRFEGDNNNNNNNNNSTTLSVVSEDNQPSPTEKLTKNNASSNITQFKQSPQRRRQTISILEIICDTFSIRGVARMRRGPPFLRGLWFCFVLIMTIGLLLTTYLLVQDYLIYDVSENINVIYDTRSPFPALTICHHHPFSQNAYQLWRNGQVLFPHYFD
ncbi:unnamed protein product [Trichobilharzia regenti]|nr:unnamed protein product [Trichobilharzia regenti]